MISCIGCDSHPTNTLPSRQHLLSAVLGVLLSFGLGLNNPVFFQLVFGICLYPTPFLDCWSCALTLPSGTPLWFGVLPPAASAHLPVFPQSPGEPPCTAHSVHALLMHGLATPNAHLVKSCLLTIYTLSTWGGESSISLT